MSVKKVVKLVACVAAQDGIISKVELDTAFKLINESIENINKDSFDSCISEFFEEESTLEDYLLAISKKYNPEIILEICYKSATSDGLEIRENLAFDKACKFWEKDISNFH
tara:strand:+ start:302 stop:634 length:333 start_codon:yes stop_codon:yes gene_type:complete